MRENGAFPSGSGPIMCDILPSKPATLHDIFSGTNLCDECANCLRSYAAEKGYFSKGVYPKPKPPNRTASTVFAGVGIILEVGGQDMTHYITRVLTDGPAAQEGSIMAGDALRFVDGQQVTGLSPATVAPMISGKEGSMVEMTVEREGQLLRPVRVRRGAATVSRGGSESFQSYEQVPFYLSSEDRKIAQEEAAARVQRLRNQMRNVAFPVYQSCTSATSAPRSPPSASASPPKASSTSPQSQQQQQPDARMMHRVDPQVPANKSNAAAIAQGQQRQGQQQHQQQQQSAHGVETAAVYSDARRQEELRLLHEKQEKQQQQLLELQQQQQQKQKHLEMMKMQEANAASAQSQHQQITLKASAPPLPPSPASAPGFAQPQSPPQSTSADAPRSPQVQDAGVMPNTSTGGGAGASPPAHPTAPSGSSSPSIGSTSSVSPPQHNSQAMSQAMGTPASVMTTAERQHQRLGTQI